MLFFEGLWRRCERRGHTAESLVVGRDIFALLRLYGVGAEWSVEVEEVVVGVVATASGLLQFLGLAVQAVDQEHPFPRE